MTRCTSPFGLVKTSGSSHGGEHSAAVKMEASNPCINETDKLIRSPEGDLYRRAGNELGAKMKQNECALHEGISTRTTRSVGYSFRRLNRSIWPKRRNYKTNSNQLINRLVMIIRSNTQSIYYPLSWQKSNLIHGNRRIRYVHAALLVRPKN